MIEANLSRQMRHDESKFMRHTGKNSQIFCQILYTSSFRSCKYISYVQTMIGADNYVDISYFSDTVANIRKFQISISAILKNSRHFVSQVESGMSLYPKIFRRTFSNCLPSFMLVTPNPQFLQYFHLFAVL